MRSTRAAECPAMQYMTNLQCISHQPSQEVQQRKHNLREFLYLCTSSFNILKRRNHRELPAACLGQRELNLLGMGGHFLNTDSLS